MTKKEDPGELLDQNEDGTLQEPEAPVEEKPKRTRGPAIVVSEEAVLAALEKAGGEAKITPLYEAFDKTDYEGVEPAKLKTAIRKMALKLAKAEKLQALHVDEKRTFTFKSA